MSNKGSFDFYCLWEELFNEDFKLAVSREFKNDSANQSFTMSPSRWISMTNAKGFVSKREKYEFIVLAINPKYRGNGISTELLDKMFNEYDNKYDYMWRCDKENSISNIIAKRYNFKLLNSNDIKNEYILHK